MKTFPCLLACSALLTAAAIAPAALAQDPAAASPGPGYGYGAPPAAGYPAAGYPAPAYAAPTGYYLPAYGAPAGYYGPDARPWAYRNEQGTERRSPAMMITGFTMAGIGVGGVITGALVFAFSQAVQYDGAIECIQAPCYSGYSSSPSAGEVGGVAAMVSGGLLIAVGLPLGIYGSGKKPREDQASPVPQVSLGPTGGRVRWTF
jgi:hypothetical protein